MVPELSFFPCTDIKPSVSVSVNHLEDHSLRIVVTSRSMVLVIQVLCRLLWTEQEAPEINLC
jgi:hypothetical protein